jgi:uncharacterized membrane protein
MRKGFWRNIFRTTVEGRILFWALVALSAFVLCLLAVALKDALLARNLLFTFLSHLIGGRMAGVAICLSMDFNPIATVAYNMFLEVLIVVFAYALFALSYNHYLDFRFVRVAEKHIEAQAHKHEATIARFGWLGLFVFAGIPLPVAGPLMGVIVGYILKFKPLRNFSAVFSGTLVALVLWAFFFNAIKEKLYLVQYAVIFIILFVLAYGLFDIRKWLKEEKKD